MISSEVCRSLKDNAGGGLSVNPLDSSDSILREAQFTEDIVELGMTYGVEGIAEVDVKGIQVPIGGAGILEGVHQPLEVASGTATCPEALLGLTEDLIGL